MNKSNLADLSQVSPKKWDLSHNNCYITAYHISETAVKCPRCQNLGELIEDAPVRALYRCEKCGIFSKLTPKKQSRDGKPIECRLKNPCQGCEGKSGIITPVDRSTGNPHHYRLSCADCGRFQRWVSQHELGKGGNGNG